MSTLAFVYALLAGVSMAVLAIGLRLAAPGIHPALGIAIVTGIAFLVNVLVALAMRATTGRRYRSPWRVCTSWSSWAWPLLV